MRTIPLILSLVICLVTCPRANAIAPHSYSANACINFGSRDEMTPASKQSLAQLLELLHTPSSPTAAGDTQTGSPELQVVLRMVACALTSNISGEATTPLGNILGEAMRQAPSAWCPVIAVDSYPKRLSAIGVLCEVLHEK
jgi:hypothetical protein